MPRRPAMPKTIKVGAHVYEIKRPYSIKRDGVVLDGLCEASELRILARRTLKLSRAQVTILHEIMHGCLCAADIEEEVEEKVIATLAEAMLQVVRENANLVNYLQS